MFGHAKLLQLVEAHDDEGTEAFWHQPKRIAGEGFLKEYGETTVVNLLA